MNVEELIEKLQQLVKQNPTIATAIVKLPPMYIGENNLNKIKYENRDKAQAVVHLSVH